LKLLAVETALGACSVAVLAGEKILAHRFEEMVRGHAEALAPMVEDAMREAGIAFAALDRLAVTTGPGTFTGQRVGLAFMRGLRVALRKPLIGITTLEAMAAATKAKRAASIHDAKRDEAYLLLWEAGETFFAPAVMPFAHAIERIRGFGPCALAGTGAPAASAALGDGFTLTDIRQPDALWVARLAMARPAPEGPPAPLYLRAPDAKLPRSIGQEKWEPAPAGEPVFRSDVRPRK
jgi:tRNA threonylcarbamoyladenosine biosynthesis protein TsaB